MLIEEPEAFLPQFVTLSSKVDHDAPPGRTFRAIPSHLALRLSFTNSCQLQYAIRSGHSWDYSRAKTISIHILVYPPP